MKSDTTKLWIAFKICIFDFQKQLGSTTTAINLCCELLSKFVSLTFRNSKSTPIFRVLKVVNCFQNLYLWLSETACLLSQPRHSELWIAFKICIFDFQKQQSVARAIAPTVVNCFQNLYLWLSETASQKVYVWVSCCELLSKFVSLTFRNSFLKELIEEKALWIAFKICIFDFQKQQCSNVGWINIGCELLSKFVSLTFRNSSITNGIKKILLWIAFKICIFDFQKQLTVSVSELRNSNGNVVFALYNREDAFPDEHYKKYYKIVSGKITNRSSVVVFKDLRIGQYAVNILHDENNDGKIKKKLFLPVEGIGFSNFQSIGFSNRPTFEKASFNLRKSTTIKVTIFYF